MNSSWCVRTGPAWRPLPGKCRRKETEAQTEVGALVDLGRSCR